MDKLYIPIILGTGREGRQSEKVANYMLEVCNTDDRFETELIDVRDYPSPFTARVKQENFDDKGLVKKIEAADGFIIVAPEYNHGYPGELKILLDHYFPEFHRKPVGICAVSGGSLGGSRMVEELRLVMIALKSVNLNSVLSFPGVSELFDDSGKLKDPDVYTPRLEGFFEELLWYANALKPAREA